MLKHVNKNIKIKNQYDSIDGRSVTKTTQLLLKNKVVRIIDHYTPDNLVQSLETQNVLNASENLILKSSIINLLGDKEKGNVERVERDECKLRDSKNVVKNISNLFLRWLDKYYSPNC